MIDSEFDHQVGETAKYRKDIKVYLKQSLSYGSKYD